MVTRMMIRMAGRLGLVLALASGVSACVVEDAQRNIVRPPAYASPQGGDGYSVFCGAREVTGHGHIGHLFYEPDGTPKSARTFCAENGSEGLIR